ncbi:MAG: hypothetical protein ACYTBX_19775 [Planctomycetota bacterium]|jgi:hypothetical protein
MAGAILCAIDDVLPEDKINDTCLTFVVGYEEDKNGERPSATARLIIRGAFVLQTHYRQEARPS